MAEKYRKSTKNYNFFQINQNAEVKKRGRRINLQVGAFARVRTLLWQQLRKEKGSISMLCIITLCLSNDQFSLSIKITDTFVRNISIPNSTKHDAVVCSPPCCSCSVCCFIQTQLKAKCSESQSNCQLEKSIVPING